MHLIVLVFLAQLFHIPRLSGRKLLHTRNGEMNEIEERHRFSSSYYLRLCILHYLIRKDQDQDGCPATQLETSE
jgi:hypothetical protein